MRMTDDLLSELTELSRQYFTDEDPRTMGEVFMGVSVADCYLTRLRESRRTGEPMRPPPHGMEYLQ